MQYRKIRKVNIDVSAFGLGCMRFPMDGEKIDFDQSIDMIRYAIDNGVNYIDTAYPYHEGESENIVGKALTDGYREKTYLATKSPLWLIKSYADFEKYLDEQLEKLKVDYVDFYLLHAVGDSNWNKMKSLNVLEFLESMVKKGKIRFPSFSYHGSLGLFKQVIDDYDKWIISQIMLNYIDDNFQAGIEGMKYAYDKGVDTVVMEPLKGGALVNYIPDEVKELFNSLNHNWNPVEWSMRWVYNFQEVAVVLSGVSSMEQLKEQIDIVDKALPNNMTKEKLELITKARDIFINKFEIPCSSCMYCQPCPKGVLIPDIFAIYNMYKLFNSKGSAKLRYGKMIDGKKDASVCIECGKCEEHCPQEVSIIDGLKKADEVLRSL